MIPHRQPANHGQLMRPAQPNIEQAPATYTTLRDTILCSRQTAQFMTDTAHGRMSEFSRRPGPLPFSPDTAERPPAAKTPGEAWRRMGNREMIARKGRAPVGEYPDEPSLGNVPPPGPRAGKPGQRRAPAPYRQRTRALVPNCFK